MLWGKSKTRAAAKAIDRSNIEIGGQGGGGSRPAQSSTPRSNNIEIGGRGAERLRITVVVVVVVVYVAVAVVAVAVFNVQVVGVIVPVVAATVVVVIQNPNIYSEQARAAAAQIQSIYSGGLTAENRMLV